MRHLTYAASALAFGAASLLAGEALAVDCTTLPNPVYTAGSTAIKPTMAKIATYLAGQTTPVTLVYLGSGSCNGVATVVNQSLLSTPTGMTGYFTYWDSTGTAQTCDVAAPGVALNIGLSDVFPDTCQTLPNGLPTGVTDNKGPVQAMTFVVPASSTESSISAEAAYMVFGFGNASGVDPWTDVKSVHQRGAGSGTQAMIAKAIAVPAARWYGVTETSTGNMITAMVAANSGLNTKAIGIMAAEDVDGQRIAAAQAMMPVPLRELAYQHFGQNCGYLPDSGPNAFDKRNVRDGHYAIWGPIHAFLVPNADNTVYNNSKTIVSFLTGTVQATNLDLIAFEAQSGIIPQCAMRVVRSQEMGPMTPNTPTSPCGCYYEKIANKTTSCTPCSKNQDCPTNYTCPIYGGQGWCEAP